MKTVLQRCI